MASGLLIRQIQRKAGAKGYQWRPGPPQPFRPKGIADGYFEDDNEGEDEMARIARLKLYDYQLDATERAGYGEFLANYNLKKSIAQKNGNFTKEFQKWLLGSSHLNDIVPWKHQSLEPVIPTIGQYLSKEIEEAFLVQYYLCRLFVLGPSNEIECEHYFRYLVYPVQKAYDTLVEAGLGGYDDGQPKDVGAKVLQICSTWYSRMTQGINVPEFPCKLIYANRIPGGYQLQVEGDGEYSYGAYEADAPDNVMFDKAVNPYMRDRLEYDWVRLMKGESLTANHWARLLEYSRGKNFYLLNPDIESQRVEYSQQLLEAGGNEEGTLQPGDTRQINDTIPGAGKIIKEESNIQIKQEQEQNALEKEIKQEPEEASGSASEIEENSSESEESSGNDGAASSEEKPPQPDEPAADEGGVTVPAAEPAAENGDPVAEPVVTGSDGAEVPVEGEPLAEIPATEGSESDDGEEYFSQEESEEAKNPIEEVPKEEEKPVESPKKIEEQPREEPVEPPKETSKPKEEKKPGMLSRITNAVTSAVGLGPKEKTLEDTLAEKRKMHEGLTAKVIEKGNMKEKLEAVHAEFPFDDKDYKKLEKMTKVGGNWQTLNKQLLAHMAQEMNDLAQSHPKAAAAQAKEIIRLQKEVESEKETSMAKTFLKAAKEGISMTPRVTEKLLTGAASVAKSTAGALENVSTGVGALATTAAHGGQLLIGEGKRRQKQLEHEEEEVHAGEMAAIEADKKHQLAAIEAKSKAFNAALRNQQAAIGLPPVLAIKDSDSPAKNTRSKNRNK